MGRKWQEPHCEPHCNPTVFYRFDYLSDDVGDAVHGRDLVVVEPERAGPEPASGGASVCVEVSGGCPPHVLYTTQPSE